jgi:hypothetical protein
MPEIQLADVFVEMADTLVDDFDVIEFLHGLTERCVELLGVLGGGIAAHGPARRAAGGGRLLRTDPMLELFQLQADQGPCLDCFHTGQPSRCRSALGRPLAAVHRRRGRGRLRRGTRLPMRLRSDVIGALNLFDATPGALDEAKLRIGQASADVATIGLLQNAPIRPAMPSLNNCKPR